MASELPPRPDDGADIPVLVPPRRRTSSKIVAVIVVSCLVFVVLIAVFVIATLDSQEHQVERIIQQVQHCIDHQKDPNCNVSLAPSP